MSMLIFRQKYFQFCTPPLENSTTRITINDYTVQLHSQFNYRSHDRTLRKCKFCGEYDKRTIENDLDFDRFQDCSCACKECGDLAKDCRPCRLIISNHFRYVPKILTSRSVNFYAHVMLH